MHKEGIRWKKPLFTPSYDDDGMSRKNPRFANWNRDSTSSGESKEEKKGQSSKRTDFAFLLPSPRKEQSLSVLALEAVKEAFADGPHPASNEGGLSELRLLFQ